MGSFEVWIEQTSYYSLLWSFRVSDMFYHMKQSTPLAFLPRLPFKVYKQYACLHIIDSIKIDIGLYSTDDPCRVQIKVRLFTIVTVYWFPMNSWDWYFWYMYTTAWSATRDYMMHSHKHDSYNGILRLFLLSTSGSCVRYCDLMFRLFLLFKQIVYWTCL